MVMNGFGYVGNLLIRTESSIHDQSQIADMWVISNKDIVGIGRWWKVRCGFIATRQVEEYGFGFQRIEGKMLVQDPDVYGIIGR